MSVCQNVKCLHREADTAGGLQTQMDELRICSGCLEHFEQDLSSLPELYRLCEEMLATSPWDGEKVSGTRPVGISLNVRAVDVRDTLRARLAAWCDLVVAEHGCPIPGHSVASMASYLHRHARWLCIHPAAGDVVAEFAETKVAAKRVAYPARVRKFQVGSCVEADCGGSLVAAIQTDDQMTPSEVRCDADPQHVWPAQQWRELDGRVGRKKNSGGRWLTVKEVSQFWTLSVSNVYRLASENSWRRRTNGRRVYYFEADIIASVG